MADKKISALTAATTPLAGTEVLPIVQSGSTVKVSVANLTDGRAVAMAGGSFTDNITQSTAAKGVNFTANTPAAGMTSQLLNWYEEGTWTPTQGAGLIVVGTFSSSGLYTRIGRLVYVVGSFSGSTSVEVVAGTIMIGGLPFSSSGNYSVNNAMNGSANASIQHYISGTNSYAISALAPAGTVFFSAVYST